MANATASTQPSGTAASVSSAPPPAPPPDSGGSSGVGSIALAPEMAMGALYQSFAHSTGILYENAVQAQQQLATIAQTATNLGVALLYAVTPGAKSGATDSSGSAAAVSGSS